MSYFLSITLLLFHLFFPKEIYSASTTVNTTVPSFNFPSANLITPTNNLATNNARPTFSWSRPSPIIGSPLNHYDLYLDDVAFISNIPDNLTSQTMYFYTATASSGIFYINLNTDLTQGHHTWRIISYNDAGNSSTTGNWNFYIDSIYPVISLTEVDNTNYSWITTNPSSIPSEDNRHLTVSTDDPLISGTVEENANLSLYLLCPSGAPTSCTSQNYTGNYPSGNWSHVFYNLIPNVSYSVYLLATDSTGNSTSFPVFYLAYGQTTTPTSTPTPTTSPSPSPTATTTPKPSTTIRPTTTPTLIPYPTSSISATPTPESPTLPMISATLTPPPDLLNVITPTSYIPKPPPSPTVPPPKTNIVLSGYDLGKILFLILLLLGLPLHLAAATYGTQTPVSMINHFLFVLAYPFFGNKNYQTIPFTSIIIYPSEKLQKPWKKIVSDINGKFNLPKEIPETVYIIASARQRIWKNSLFKNTTLQTSCLFLNKKQVLSTHDKSTTAIYDLRAIPLVLANLTALGGLFIYPSVYVIIYLYLSLQYTFSEYLYPRLKNS